jgi:hypothetical protein
MRDPDLVVRAQKAATALERAWCHWRSTHGLDAEPAPPVSSYVGYSLDAPWGQARIVFGICAEEAEQLAALLEHHDCVGPVHASVTARPVGPSRQSQANGQVHVPAPAPASAGQQSAPAGSGAPRQDHPDKSRRPDPAATAAALTGRAEPPPANGGTPIALAASRAVAAAIASREQAAARSAADRAITDRSVADRSIADRAAAPEHAVADAATAVAGLSPVPARPVAAIQPVAVPTAPQAADGEVSRDGRGMGGPSWSRLKRQGPVSDCAVSDCAPAAEQDQVQLAGRPQDSRDRLTSPAATADAAAWAASELPGQAAISDTAV